LGITTTLPVATHHKLIKKIKDEKFDEEKLQQYVLLAQIGAKDFSGGGHR